MPLNAPAGPPICTCEPPSTEISQPAMLAVKLPGSGLTPEAMANAMVSGKATMPTVKPAPTSALNCWRL